MMISLLSRSNKTVNLNRLNVVAIFGKLCIINVGMEILRRNTYGNH